MNIGSVLGLVAVKDRAAYCASKGGVTLLTKAMALDHAQDNIRVNCICPSVVETDLVRDLWAQFRSGPSVRRKLVWPPFRRAGLVSRRILPDSLYFWPSMSLRG